MFSGTLLSGILLSGTLLSGILFPPIGDMIVSIPLRPGRILPQVLSFSGDPIVREAEHNCPLKKHSEKEKASKLFVRPGAFGRVQSYLLSFVRFAARAAGPLGKLDC